MDYLTVPAMSSVPQMEKAITKDDQSQGPLLGPGGSGPPAGGQGPGTTYPTPMTQEGGTVLPLNRLLSFSRSRESRRLSRFSRTTRGSKVTRSSQRSKAAVKPVRRRRKRKRRRVNLKDLLVRWWQRTRPHLTYLWQIIYDLTQSFFFDFFICTVVALNTMLLVAQTFAVIEIRGEWFFSAMDPVFLCVYVVEAVLKLIALRFKYFHDPWNDIDFFIMVMTVLDFLLPLFISSRQGNRGNTVALFRVLKICKGVRAIRALRFLLTLRVMENLQEVTSTFMLSSQSIGAIILLMFSFLFMSSVVLRDMFHDADEKHFGDLFSTIFTLFQLFTLDDWSLIYLTCYAAGAWYIIIFLIVYILVEYFLLLNLVIAVLVDNFQMALLKRRELQKQRFEDYIQPKDSRVEEDPSKKLTEKTKEREETDEEFFRRNVMDKYSGVVLGQRGWELLYSYFQLMTAIETNQQQFYSQATTTDKILDTFFETAEEEEPMH